MKILRRADDIRAIFGYDSDFRTSEVICEGIIEGIYNNLNNGDSSEMIRNVPEQYKEEVLSRMGALGYSYRLIQSNDIFEFYIEGMTLCI